LSTTTAPEAHAAAANSLLRRCARGEQRDVDPLERVLREQFDGKLLTGELELLPTERSEARRRRFLIGNFRSARICRKTSPTAPVAPATAR